MKRLFDLAVASILLLILAPIMLTVAICIKLDSPGPVFYWSPRIGKGGKRFGQLRFRTVAIDKPAYLSMRDRLTRVGRFIRNYSLDDLPNLFNVLWGDVSIIGPRPTEPERVDLTDPRWQQILTVRPGIFSPAILVLAQQYNASPNTLKEQLEIEYIQKQSFRYDLRLFGQALRRHFASRGNWKARGTPSVAIIYPQYQPGRAALSAVTQSDTSVWVVANWKQPDLTYVATFVRYAGQGWSLSEPHFCLVPCINLIQKPAIFLRIDKGHAIWTGNVEWIDMQWLIAETNRYVCLGCILCFEDKSQPVGDQRLSCSTLLDVASPDVESWFSTWQNCSEIPLFLMNEDLEEIRYRFLPNEGHTEAKTATIQQWQEAKTRLQQSGFALGNFTQEAKILREALMHSGIGENQDSTKVK